MYASFESIVLHQIVRQSIVSMILRSVIALLIFIFLHFVYFPLPINLHLSVKNLSIIDLIVFTFN